MSSFDKVQKVLDATTGESDEFEALEGILKYKLVITGTPLANIKAFFIPQYRSSSAYFLKVKCDNWNSATVTLLAKTKHSEDDFSNTGDSFTENEVQPFIYRN